MAPSSTANLRAEAAKGYRATTLLLAMPRRNQSEPFPARSRSSCACQDSGQETTSHNRRTHPSWPCGFFLLDFRQVSDTIVLDNRIRRLYQTSVEESGL